MFAVKAHHWGMDQPGQHAFRSLWLPLELRVRMMIMVVVVCPDRNFNDFFTGFCNWKNAEKCSFPHENQPLDLLDLLRFLFLFSSLFAFLSKQGSIDDDLWMACACLTPFDHVSKNHQKSLKTQAGTRVTSAGAEAQRFSGTSTWYSRSKTEGANFKAFWSSDSAVTTDGFTSSPGSSREMTSTSGSWSPGSWSAGLSRSGHRSRKDTSSTVICLFLTSFTEPLGPTDSNSICGSPPHFPFWQARLKMLKVKAPSPSLSKFLKALPTEP